MREHLLLGALAAFLLGSSAGANPPPSLGNRNIHVIVDVNVNTWSSQWVSSGAFVDSGTVDPGREATPHGAATMVSGPLHGANGSFTWEFVAAYTGPLNGGRYRTQGSWTMIDGTGAYEGISGRGTITGWWDQSTKDFHSEFVGTVDCPNCP